MPIVASSPRQLLARVLEDPALPTRIAALEPAALARLVRRVGLEDAGELLAYASAAQLRDLFDEDLWTSENIGEDARFDAARFGVWLEVLLEAGDRAVVEKLAELPEELVTLAFHAHVHVVHVDALMAEVADADDDLLEKAMSDALSEEIDDYHLFARRTDAWDAVLTTLLAFDRDRHDELVRLLARLAHATASEVDDGGGLYEVLTAAETLEVDAAADREDRRARRGHVAPSGARAFLALARAGEASDERDAIATAYFRELDRDALTRTADPRSSGAALGAPRGLARSSEGSEALGALVAEVESTSLPAAETARLVTVLERALERLPSPVRFVRSEELAFTANVVAEGVAVQGRRLRPFEAVRAALGAVNLGLELVLAERGLSGEEAAARVLAEIGCDLLFRRAVAHSVRTLEDAARRSNLPKTDPARIAALAPFPYLVDGRGEPAFLDSLGRLASAVATLAPVRARKASGHAPDRPSRGATGEAVTRRKTSTYPGGSPTAPRSRRSR